MLTSILSAGVTPEVNMRITQMRKDTKGIHPGFETQGRCHQKSKMGVSVATHKGLMSSNNFKKNNKKQKNVQNIMTKAKQRKHQIS